MPVHPAIFAIDTTPCLVRSDIDILIHTGMDRSKNLQTLGITDKALERIQNGSQGMFLSVKFMIDDLDRPLSKAEVLQRLQDLPSGLEKAYHQLLLRLLDALGPLDRSFLRDLFCLVIAARRPLQLEELKYALAVISRAATQRLNEPPLEDFVVESLADRIGNLCGSLI